MKTPKKIMDAARDEDCTFNIPGVCNYNNETVVTCHLSDGTGGSNRLTGPLSIAFGCSDCHRAIDGYDARLMSGDRDFFMRRAMMRTINRLLDLGLVKIG